MLRRVFAIAIGVGALSIHAQTTIIDFNQAPVIQLNNHPLDVAIRDFDGDGKPDLAVVPSAGAILILPGNGSVFFQEPRIVPMGGGYIYRMAVADLNNDARPDFVWAGSTNIGVMLNQGKGAFEAPRNFPMPSDTRWVVTSDLDRDGRLDIISCSDQRTAVTLLMNKGTNFTPAAVETGDFASRVEAGDFNQDGNPDLAVLNPGQSVRILAGRGDGTFSLTQKIDLARPGALLKSDDFNQDGKPDLAIIHDDGSLGFLRGRGDAQFDFVSNTRGTGGGFLDDLETADLDDDGLPDVTVTSTAGYVTIFLSRPNGAFAVHRYSAAISPRGLGISDINGDGKLDIVTANSFGSTLRLLINKGEGQFAGSESYVPGGGVVALVDLNRGRAPDLVSADEIGFIHVRTGSKDGSFGALNSYEINELPNRMALGDINNDANWDIVVGLYHRFALAILMGKANGEFVRVQDLELAGQPAGMITGDFNNDGKEDLVVTMFGTNSSVFLGNGDGTFKFGQSLAFFSGGAYAVAASDFNKDGNLDVILGLAVFMGDGNGGFSPHGSYWDAPSFLNDVEAVDISGDGIIDIVAIGGRSQLAVYLGRGDGKFYLDAKYAISDGGSAAAIADYNGDGHLDVAVATSYHVILMQGDGTGQLSITGRFPVWQSSRGDLAAADLNEDGRVDLVKAAGGLSVLLNQTSLRLTIDRNNESMTLRWPAFTAGLFPEYTENLNSPWQVLALNPSVEGKHYIVRESKSTAPRFYRLKRH